MTTEPRADEWYVYWKVDGARLEAALAVTVAAQQRAAEACPGIDMALLVREPVSAVGLDPPASEQVATVMEIYRPGPGVKDGVCAIAEAMVAAGTAGWWSHVPGGAPRRHVERFQRLR